MTSPSKLIGQSIVTNLPQLNFGTIVEEQDTTLPVILYNTTDDPIKVVDLQFFDTYHAPAFFANQQTFIIEPEDSQTVQITFAPLQNILHNTEMFIVTENRGAFSLDLIGQGHFTNDYYASTENLNGEALKDELTSIISNNTVSLGYNDARDELYMVIDNQKVNGQNAPVNTIECVYTSQTRENYANRSQLQNMGFNCEHTWPQSYGAEDEPRKSDLHHLYPTNAEANSRRGNNPFGVVTNPNWQENGSKSSNSLFEPRNEHKGAAARTLFYFAVRYQNESGVSSSWLNPQEDILREWCNEFPPDDLEKIRNEAIYTLQNNKNPFVDYPQFVERIADFTTSGNNTKKELEYSDEIIDFGFIEDNVDYTYSFVIYNDGYLDITLSDFQLVGAEVFSLVESPMNTTLPPGEDITIQVGVNTTSEEGQQASLQFSHDGGTTASQTEAIPLFANTNVGTGVIPVEPDLKDAIELYPNPAKNYLNIQIDEVFTAKKSLTIYDVTGKTILSIKVGDSNQHLLPLNQLRNGIYWLQIENDEHKVIKPFVVQK